jgi:serine/threonine-protein kinase
MHLMNQQFPSGSESLVNSQGSIEDLSRIGRYEILSELGRGAVGRVFLARDPNIDRKVALKVFAPRGDLEAGQESDLHRRFVLEAQAAGRLRHPGIVTVFDAASDTTAGLSYIAMEYVEGASLKHRLDRSGPLPLDEAIFIVGQVALALGSAHSEGLVHRDIKPANILISSDGVAKVTDFGVVKFASMSETVAGTVLGSPFYMSPEQLKEEHIDGRSDLFSLGVVLYECVTGEVPFTGTTIPAITYKILEIDPRPPELAQPLASDLLIQVMKRALAKDPEERYQSGQEFAEALGIPVPNSGVESGMVNVQAPPPEAETPSSEGPVPGEPVESRLGSGTAALSEPRLQTTLAIVRKHAGWVLLVGGAILAALILMPWTTSVTEGPQIVESVTPPPIVFAEDETPLEFPESPPEQEEPELQPVPSQPDMSTLNVRYNNRLKLANMSIWIDERKLWERDVAAPKNVFKRLAGKDVRTKLEVPAGEHIVEVRMRRSEGKPDLTSEVAAVFEPDRSHLLRVRYVRPGKLKLSLTNEFAK